MAPSHKCRAALRLSGSPKLRLSSYWNWMERLPLKFAIAFRGTRNTRWEQDSEAHIGSSCAVARLCRDGDA